MAKKYEAEGMPTIFQVLGSKKHYSVVWLLFQHIPVGYRYTLLDIGQVINKLMGGTYQSSYCRKKFRSIYNAITHKVWAFNYSNNIISTSRDLIEGRVKNNWKYHVIGCFKDAMTDGVNRRTRLDAFTGAVNGFGKSNLSFVVQNEHVV